MTRRLISSGSSFEADIGYSRAVCQGDWVFVSGTTGFDYTTMTISSDIQQQTQQCLQNIEAALLQAGSKLDDVVRVTYVLPDAADDPIAARQHMTMQVQIAHAVFQKDQARHVSSDRKPAQHLHLEPLDVD